MITLKQSLWLALELRDKYLQNVEPVERPDKMGRKHAAHLLTKMINAPENVLEFDQVQRDVGWIMSLLVERRDAAAADLDKLVAHAKTFDMRVEGSILSEAQPGSIVGQG